MHLTQLQVAGLLALGQQRAVAERAFNEALQELGLELNRTFSISPEGIVTYLDEIETNHHEPVMLEG